MLRRRRKLPPLVSVDQNTPVFGSDRARLPLKERRVDRAQRAELRSGARQTGSEEGTWRMERASRDESTRRKPSEKVPVGSVSKVWKDGLDGSGVAEKPLRIS